jgi:hypothetical protein
VKNMSKSPFSIRVRPEARTAAKARARAPWSNFPDEHAGILEFQQEKGARPQQAMRFRVSESALRERDMLRRSRDVTFTTELQVPGYTFDYESGGGKPQQACGSVEFKDRQCKAQFAVVKRGGKSMVGLRFCEKPNAFGPFIPVQDTTGTARLLYVQELATRMCDCRRSGSDMRTCANKFFPESRRGERMTIAGARRRKKR